MWLAEVEGHRAGLVAIKDDYVDQPLVVVELQRQGVSTALLQKARECPPVLGKRRGAPHSCGISGRATKILSKMLSSTDPGMPGPYLCVGRNSVL